MGKGASASPEESMAEAAPPDAAATKVLKPQAIIDKLNRIPVFCLSDEDGDLLMVQAEDGSEPCVLWHTDAKRWPLDHKQANW